MIFEFGFPDLKNEAAWLLGLFLHDWHTGELTDQCELFQRSDEGGVRLMTAPRRNRRNVSVEMWFPPWIPWGGQDFHLRLVQLLDFKDNDAEVHTYPKLHCQCQHQKDTKVPTWRAMNATYSSIDQICLKQINSNTVTSHLSSKLVPNYPDSHGDESC